MQVQTNRVHVHRTKGRRLICANNPDTICGCPHCRKLRKNGMTKTYNKAGLTAREHYQSSDDPCGYVTDTPNQWHTQINETVDAALQRINEIRESNPDKAALAHSLRCYQLIREMASSAGRKPEGGLQLLAARVQAVFNQL